MSSKRCFARAELAVQPAVGDTEQRRSQLASGDELEDGRREDAQHSNARVHVSGDLERMVCVWNEQCRCAERRYNDIEAAPIVVRVGTSGDDQGPKPGSGSAIADFGNTEQRRQPESRPG